jgi:hypothetical protein
MDRCALGGNISGVNMAAGIPLLQAVDNTSEFRKIGAKDSALGWAPKDGPHSLQAAYRIQSSQTRPAHDWRPITTCLITE